MVPLSNVLEVMMSTTAMSRSAVFSRYTGVLPGTHAQRWFAGAVSGFHRSRSAGGVDQADILVVHQVGIVLQGVRLETCENAFGRAVLHRRLVHDPHRFVAAAPGAGMRAEDHCIPRLDRHDALEEHRRGGIRNRGKRKDDADGFGHLYYAAFGKLANDANGAFVLDVVVDKLRGHHVLEGLVFQDPEPGFLNRKSGEILRLFQSGQDHRFDNAIDVLLRVLRKDGSGGPGLADESFQVSNPFFIEACNKLCHTSTSFQLLLGIPSISAAVTESEVPKMRSGNFFIMRYLRRGMQ